MNKRIGIDAGHGGGYTGTYSIDSRKDGLFEKHYTLEVARAVRDRLIPYGFEVIMTRENDNRPGDVSQRAKMLASAKCDYAVSIHFNGSENASANGCEVFVPYEATNGIIEAGYQKYLGELFDIRKPFARSNNSLNRNETFDKRLNLNTGKFEAATALKSDYFGFVRTGWADGMQSDLLEICFLTNRKDFEVFTRNKDKVADAIARAIVEGYGFLWDGTPKQIYRVGTDWKDGKCVNQTGAYYTLRYAVNACKFGQKVFTKTGTTVYANMYKEKGK